MKELTLKLDYLNGPIWKDQFDTNKNELCTGITVIDSDLYLSSINDEIQEIYLNCFDINDTQEIIFNHNKAKESKNILLLKIDKLINYLNKINDGSFTIHNEVYVLINNW